MDLILAMQQDRQSSKVGAREITSILTLFL